MNSPQQSMRYSPNITAGSLKVPESRIVAGLLLRNVSQVEWKQAILVENVLQTRSRETARRLADLIRDRLQLMEPPLWQLVRDGSHTAATHAVFAAAIKHSPLLGDFLDLVVREEYRLFHPRLTPALWDEFLVGCRGRDPDMAEWTESTCRRLRSTVFQTLAQAGILENTKTLKLQPVLLASEVVRYLETRQEAYVLRCLEICQ